MGTIPNQQDRDRLENAPEAGKIKKLTGEQLEWDLRTPAGSRRSAREAQLTPAHPTIVHPTNLCLRLTRRGCPGFSHTVPPPPTRHH